MKKQKPVLRDVSKPAPAEPAPSYDYESEQRRRIMSRDWEKVHVEAERRAPFGFIGR